MTGNSDAPSLALLESHQAAMARGFTLHARRGPTAGDAGSETCRQVRARVCVPKLSKLEEALLQYCEV